MPATLQQIRHLEVLADRAWPPGEIRRHDGWELRATRPGIGIGKRVNSVAPRRAGTMALSDKVSVAEDFYRERGLAPTFKLTDAALPGGLDAYLASRGYRRDAPVLVLTRPLAGTAAATAPDLPATPAAEWLAANAGVPAHYGAAPAAFLDLVGRIRRPVGFAAVDCEGRTSAIGMAVADAGWVGLFEIGTLPLLRRRRLATAAVERLLAWGAGRGARRAYLQVMEENAPARALYARLGFEEAYRYWFRVAA